MPIGDGGLARAVWFLSVLASSYRFFLRIFTESSHVVVETIKSIFKEGLTLSWALQLY